MSRSSQKGNVKDSKKVNTVKPKSEKPRKESEKKLDQEKKLDHDNEGSEFIFIFESDGKYYFKLEDIEKTDKRTVIIHPVFYAGYDNGLNSEKVTYDAKKKEYVSSDKGNESWLYIIRKYPESFTHMDEKEVVVYDGLHFHCDGDLLEYLVGGDMKIVPLQ